ncbi:hypothetical protein P2L35_13035, partial [Enterococcus faecium]|uniref:hypothetical protein n=1 Tax=Enterococcus faecium TaxID=1352 RepID=UPI0025B10280
DKGGKRANLLEWTHHFISRLIRKFAKRQMKKWLTKFLWRFIRFAARVLWGAARWLMRNIFKTLIRLVVRPMITLVLEALVLNPAVLAGLAGAGGLGVLGYFAWDTFFKASPIVDTVYDDAGRLVASTGAEAPLGAGDVGAMRAAGPVPHVEHRDVTSISALVARGEGDYNSVNYGTRVKDKKKKGRAGTEDLENMTVNEVMQHQQAGDFNAVGRYQIITTTMPEIVRGLGLTGQEKFDRTTQDRMFDYLIGVKRRAIGDYISGRSDDLNAAVYAASQEWASVAAPAGMPLYKKKKTDPTRYGDGETSYYSGVQGNRASISAAEMAATLQRERGNNTGGQTEVTQPQVRVRADTTMSAAPPQARGQSAQHAPGSLQAQEAHDQEIIRGRRGELIAVTQ